jgi:hypothetical protein
MKLCLQLFKMIYEFIQSIKFYQPKVLRKGHGGTCVPPSEFPHFNCHYHPHPHPHPHRNPHRHSHIHHY